jgi:hypothetical protein
MEDTKSTGASKEDLSKEIHSNLSDLKAHAESLLKLCTMLTSIANGGDAALTAVKDAKVVADSMKDAKEALDKVRKALKTRAQAILKDC